MAPLGGWAAVAVLLLTTGHALANGRFPASNQIVFAPGDPNLVVARTTYGILPSRDNGKTWRYLCEDVLGLPPAASQDPELGITANQSLVAGLYTPSMGLAVSTNLGCDWSCIGGSLADQGIADIAVRPDGPDVVLALSSTYLPSDAGGGILSQVFQSPDDGAHWAALGAPLDPAVTVQTIDVAMRDPHRIYVSGTRGIASSRTASLFVSTDDAAHWTERPVTEFDPTKEESIFIGAVDPTDPDRVYLRSSSAIEGGLSRLFTTIDAGQSFQVAAQFPVPPLGAIAITGEILGFALSPDGSKIYAGTKEAGLFVAAKADMKFVKKSPIHVQCLATRGSELWACSDALSGFVVGVSTDDGATFTVKLPTITSLVGPIACGTDGGGPLACGATANASQCAEPFRALCQSLDPSGICSGDAGTGGDAGSGGAPRKSSSCGCSTPGSTHSSGIVSVLTMAAYTLRRLRKGRAHRTSE